MSNSYRFHPQASADLQEIWKFGAENSPEAADRVVQQIYISIQAWVPFPQQGHRRPDITSRALRFRLVHKYLIVYAPDERPLLILAVVHGYRSPKLMTSILRGRC